MSKKKLKLSRITKAYHGVAMKGMFVSGNEIIVVANDQTVLKKAFEQLSMVGEFNPDLTRLVRVDDDSAGPARTQGKR